MLICVLNFKRCEWYTPKGKIESGNIFRGNNGKYYIIYNIKHLFDKIEAYLVVLDQKY